MSGIRLNSVQALCSHSPVSLALLASLLQMFSLKLWQNVCNPLNRIKFKIDYENRLNYLLLLMNILEKAFVKLPLCTKIKVLMF